jgi:hypothetical protein
MKRIGIELLFIIIIITRALELLLDLDSFLELHTTRRTPQIGDQPVARSLLV